MGNYISCPNFRVHLPLLNFSIIAAAVLPTKEALFPGIEPNCLVLVLATYTQLNSYTPPPDYAIIVF